MGNDTDEVYGTIFAPICSMKFNGHSGWEFVGQVIGYDVTLEGTNAFSLIYNDEDAPNDLLRAVQLV